MRSGRTSKGALHFKGSQRERWRDPTRPPEPAGWPAVYPGKLDPLVKDSGRVTVGSATQRGKTPGNFKSRCVLTEGKPLTQASGTRDRGMVACGAALCLSRKGWPYGEATYAFSAKATEEMRQEKDCQSTESKVT